MNKDDMLNSPYAHSVNPEELETFNELCRWLEAMLSGPCGIGEGDDGTTFVINQKALVDRTKGISIIINPKEHPPPHFHVRYSDNNVSFSIRNCELLAGKIGNREHKIIKHWHEYSKNKLIEKWNETRPTDCQVGFIRNNA